MICHTCGRVIKNEEANFCEYCGASFRGENAFDINSSPVAPVTETVIVNPKDKPVSFLNWFGSQLLMFVPYVGLIMLFIWAFSNSTPPSKKNWARATLIFVGVLAVFMILYLMYIITSPIFQDMMSGAFDYNQYIQSLK